MSIVFPTVVFLTLDLQISSIRLPTLWPGMVSHPPKSHTPHTCTRTHTTYTCTHILGYTAGPEFEERIRLNEAGNPKFNFLALHDPYHAYYEHKIKEIREGVAQEAAAAPPPLMQQVCEIVITKDCFFKKKIPDNVPFLQTPAKALGMIAELEAPSVPPPEWLFSAEPPSISALEL